MSADKKFSIADFEAALDEGRPLEIKPDGAVIELPREDAPERILSPAEAASEARAKGPAHY